MTVEESCFRKRKVKVGGGGCGDKKQRVQRET